jgi:hypothetical protein
MEVAQSLLIPHKVLGYMCVFKAGYAVLKLHSLLTNTSCTQTHTALYTQQKHTYSAE